MKSAPKSTVSNLLLEADQPQLNQYLSMYVISEISYGLTFSVRKLFTTLEYFEFVWYSIKIQLFKAHTQGFMQFFLNHNVSTISFVEKCSQC